MSTRNISLVMGGKPYFTKLIHLISIASKHIHLQVYIFRLDDIGVMVLNALKAAAARGVKVYVVIDAYASPDFDNALIAKLQTDQVFIHRYSRIRILPIKIGRRLHHKILTVDGEYALVGGINIADKYYGSELEEPWLDMSVHVQGPLVKKIECYATTLWSKRKKLKLGMLVYPITKEKESESSDDFIINDWYKRKIEIAHIYNEVFRCANHDITIIASYFMPGYLKRRLLYQAARRGVSITLITSATSDVWIMKPAMHFLYMKLLKQGIQVIEWKKSVLHAKVAMYDRKWATVGSYNLNALSDYGSIEANIFTTNVDMIHDLYQITENHIVPYCNVIRIEDMHHIKHTILQPYRWLCYHLVRLLFSLLFSFMSPKRFKP